MLRFCGAGHPYRTIVSPRSGPTEMIFTGTPVSRSINST